MTRRPRISHPLGDVLLDRALDAGLTAAYKVPAGGYMGGNLEEKLRVGLLAMLKVIEEEQEGSCSA